MQLRDEISELHRRTGITFIFVTHDQTEAMALSDRIAVMEAGQIVQFGSPDDIYRRPADLSVARFVGATPINVLRISVEQGGEITANGQRLGLRVEATRGGPVSGASCHLGLRPESLDVVAAGGGEAHCTLPVLKAERLGAEVTLRLDGTPLGTAPIRVQLRSEIFDALILAGKLNETASLKVRCGDALLFDPEGRRMEPRLLDMRHAEGGLHAALR